MKRITARRSRVVVPLLVLPALVLIGVATVTASAGTRRAAAAPTPTCSLASVAGAWGHNFDGWTNNGVLTPVAGAGTTTIDKQGNVSGTETTNAWFGFPNTVLTITGTLALNADCTGTITDNLYDQSNTLQYTEVWAVVFVDNGTAMRAELASLKNRGTFDVPSATAALNADKLFPPTSKNGS